MTNPQQYNQPARPYTISRAAQAIGCSAHHLYRLIQRGEIDHVRLGRKILIPARVVEAILDGGTDD